MDTRLAMMCGQDIPIPECQLIIHQPRMWEISLIGEDDFFTGAQTLIVNKNMVSQGETVLTDINNFQIFMTIMSEKEALEKRLAVEQIFQILFPKYKVSILPRSLLFTTEGKETIMVDESNFDFLQDAVRRIVFTANSPMEQASFNPVDAKAKEIADKLMRGRQRVAAQKGGNDASILTQYLSVLVVGLHMRPEDCNQLTMFQVFDYIERYQLYMSWDIDIRVRLAGGTSDEHPDNWMKNIH